MAPLLQMLVSSLICSISKYLSVPALGQALSWNNDEKSSAWSLKTVASSRNKEPDNHIDMKKCQRTPERCFEVDEPVLGEP